MHCNQMTVLNQNIEQLLSFPQGNSHLIGSIFTIITR